MLKEKVLEVATSQIGQKEEPKGSNSGPMVDKYLAAAGVPKGSAWCMSFVYWCTSEAAKALNLQNPLFRTGGVMNQWYHVPATMKVHEPQAGDIFIMEFAHGLGHTGFVEKVEGTMIATIEGNSNEDGSREGFEVCRHTRPITAIKGFIRLSN